MLTRVSIDTLVTSIVGPGVSIVVSTVGPGVSTVFSTVSVKEYRSVVVVGTIDVRMVVLQEVYVVPGRVTVVQYQDVMYEVNQVE